MRPYSTGRKRYAVARRKTDLANTAKQAPTFKSWSTRTISLSDMVASTPRARAWLTPAKPYWTMLPDGRDKTVTSNVTASTQKQ